jgi:hypothetical protein
MPAIKPQNAKASGRGGLEMRARASTWSSDFGAAIIGAVQGVGTKLPTNFGKVSASLK